MKQSDTQPSLVWEKLIAKCQILEEIGSKIQNNDYIGERRSGLPREKIKEFINEYLSWYGECLSILPENLKDQFRSEFEGTEQSPKIKKFLEAPLDGNPNFAWEAFSVALGDETDFPNLWLYPYKTSFHTPLFTQKQLLYEARPMLSTRNSIIDGGMPEMASATPKRTKVFISYSHKDVKDLNGLLPHLQYLENNKLIDLWTDNKIKPGERWRDEIASALASAKVAILLISIDFLNSQFIADNELPPLLAAAEREGVKIVPVILRPCALLPQSLSQFQAINSTSRPLSQMTKPKREAIWAKVAKAVAEVMAPHTNETDATVRGNDSQRESIRPVPLTMTHEQVTGLLDLREAAHARNWAQVEKILQKYPDLPQAHSLVGLSMSRAVQEHFSNQLRPNYSLPAYNLGGPITPMSQIRYPLLLSPAPPKAEAIHWLEKALEYRDNPEGNVTAGLAFMYGYNDNYPMMVDAIKQTLAINPSLISDFQLPDNLMMLLYACHTLASVAEVMDNVGLKIPELEDVQQTLKDGSDPKNNPSVSAYPCLDWYAVDLSMGNNAEMPVKVVIPFPNKGLTYAQVLKQGQAPITIPPQPTSYHIETLISVEEILKRLTEIGIFLITPIQTYYS